MDPVRLDFYRDLIYLAMRRKKLVDVFDSLDFEVMATRAIIYDTHSYTSQKLNFLETEVSNQLQDVLNDQYIYDLDFVWPIARAEEFRLKSYIKSSFERAGFTDVNASSIAKFNDRTGQFTIPVYAKSESGAEIATQLIFKIKKRD